MHESLKITYRKLASWVSPRSYSIAVFAIIALGTVLRFWALRTHLHFDIDEATHTNIIWGIWRDHNLIAQGPPASGDTALYHGAFYYYLYLIPAIISRGNPLGLATFTILLSISTIWLIARFAELLWNRQVALLSSFIYAVSYFAIIYSRWIWNPNSIPFFMALSLWCLALLTRGKKNALILFAFSVASITQLHVGGFVFLPVIICMIPVLLPLARDLRIRVMSVIAFVIPWLPTIYNELKLDFPLTRALFHMLKNPSYVSLTDHAIRGFDYLDFMYKVVTQQPHIVFLFIFVSALTLLFWRYRTHASTRPVTLYIVLVLLFSFAVYAFYPGILYIHVSEHLFVIFALLTGIALGYLVQHRVFLPAVIIFMLSVAHLSWPLYADDVVHGDAQFGAIRQVCQIIQDNHDTNVTIVFNNSVNPISVTYVCQTMYNVQSPGAIVYDVHTNYKEQFTLIRHEP